MHCPDTASGRARWFRQSAGSGNARTWLDLCGPCDQSMSALLSSQFSPHTWPDQSVVVSPVRRRSLRRRRTSSSARHRASRGVVRLGFPAARCGPTARAQKLIVPVSRVRSMCMPVETPLGHHPASSARWIGSPHPASVAKEGSMNVDAAVARQPQDWSSGGDKPRAATIASGALRCKAARGLRPGSPVSLRR